MDTERILEKTPNVCGVYIMKNKQNEILYVGKAKSLKKRISSHFQRPYSQKDEILMRQVSDIEFIPTRSEQEALLLEMRLIKEKKPPYNVSYKDDKSFPWIKITNEEFPAIYMCRPKKGDDKAVYFGPYTNVKLLKQALKDIRKIFGFRSCKKLPKSPCLYFRLNLCPAPCTGNISKEKYKKLIQDICLFLEGKYKELIDIYFKRMLSLSKKEKFEEAQKIRDKIKALSSLFSSTGELEELKRVLGLSRIPVRIEAFDVSQIYGKEKTGAMVSFYMGSPDKKNYRRFKIKEVEGINDYRCMEEILKRRYRRVIREKLILPDLIIIDGGKAHLNCAEKILKGFGLDIPILAIAKSQNKKDIIFFSKKPKALDIPLESLHLIQHIRNEAHRFAIKYHHLLRRKKIMEFKNDSLCKKSL